MRRFLTSLRFSPLLILPLWACSATPPTQRGSGGQSAGGQSTSGAGGSGNPGSGGSLPGSGGTSSSGGSGTGTSGSGGIPGSGGVAGSAGASAGAGSGGKGGATGGTIVIRDSFDTVAANGPPDPTKWFPPPSGSTDGPTIDSSKFHSAPNSSRSKGTTSGQGSALVPLSGFPTPGNRFYVRAWINFEKDTSAVTGHVAFLVGGAARDQSGTELRLGISIPPGFSTAMLDLNLQAPTDGGGEVTRFSNGFTTGGEPLPVPGTTFMANTWTCVEALFDGGNNEFRVWIGDTEVMNMHVTNFAARPGDAPRSMWAPTYNFLKIGAQNYSGDLGQVWYDDVVVGSEQIGCN